MAQSKEWKRFFRVFKKELNTIQHSVDIVTDKEYSRYFGKKQLTMSTSCLICRQYVTKFNYVVHLFQHAEEIIPECAKRNIKFNKKAYFTVGRNLDIYKKMNRIT